MYAPLLELASFGAIPSDAALERCVEHVLEGLCRVNQEYLAFFDPPALYASGVRYKDDSKDRYDRWRDIPKVLQMGWGDCDDLVPWRVAELRRLGHPAFPKVVSQRNGSYLYHAMVGFPDGSIEDPSARLGMKVR